MSLTHRFGEKSSLGIHTFESGVDRFKGRDRGEKRVSKQCHQNPKIYVMFINELKPSPWEECQTFFPYAYIVKEADKEWWIHFLSDITLAK